jgi:hypothetical protein
MKMSDLARKKPESDGNKRPLKLGAFIFIVIITFLCFAPDLRNDFVYTWDDAGYITNNEHIKSLSFETLSWAFRGGNDYYWAPLTSLSLTFDYAFWGLNPLGYHLTNNILHALNAGLFFLLSLQLLQRYAAVHHTEDKRTFPSSFDHAFYCSLLAALLFSIHPLRVESVAWATERKDVLSLFFGFLAVIAYIKHTESDENHPGMLTFALSPHYWLAAALFCLSLMSKPTLVTLPLALLVLDWFPLKRMQKKSVKALLAEKAVFILIAGVISAIVITAHTQTAMPFTESDITSRALIAFKSIIYYLWFMLWPLKLSPFYLHPGNVRFFSSEYAFPVLIFFVITAYVAFLIKRKPALMAAWSIYLITLLPTLGSAQASNFAMADRFTYVPSLPLSMMAALCLTPAVVRLSGSLVKTVPVLSGIMFLLLANTYLTVRQISFWENDVALWSRAIEVKPHFSGRTYFMRGTSYAMSGEYEKALPDMNEAIAIAGRKNNTRMHDLYLERARILTHLGDFNSAIDDYTKALLSDFSPKRSVYYWERGQLYKEQGMPSLANEDFRSAATIKGNR